MSNRQTHQHSRGACTLLFDIIPDTRRCGPLSGIHCRLEEGFFLLNLPFFPLSGYPLCPGEVPFDHRYVVSPVTEIERTEVSLQS